MFGSGALSPGRRDFWLWRLLQQEAAEPASEVGRYKGKSLVCFAHTAASLLADEVLSASLIGPHELNAVRGKSGGRQREVERVSLALPPERCNVRYVDRFGGILFRCLVAVRCFLRG